MKINNSKQITFENNDEIQNFKNILHSALVNYNLELVHAEIEPYKDHLNKMIEFTQKLNDLIREG